MSLLLQAAKWDFNALPDYCLFLKQNFPLRLHIHKLQLKWNHQKKPLTEIAIETIDIFFIIFHNRLPLHGESITSRCYLQE